MNSATGATMSAGRRPIAIALLLAVYGLLFLSVGRFCFVGACRGRNEY